MQFKQLLKHPNHPPDERINILTQLCIAYCATTFLCFQFTRPAPPFGGFTRPAPPFDGFTRIIVAGLLAMHHLMASPL
jgi:hypothetical protein